MLPAEGLVDDADELGLRIEADQRLGLAIEGADEQERDAAYLKGAGDVAVVVNIDAVEIDLALVVLSNLPQDGGKTPAGLAPIGVEVHDNGAETIHLPVMGTPIGHKVPELLLVDGVDGIDGVRVHTITLGADGQSRQRQQQNKYYLLHQLLSNHLCVHARGDAKFCVSTRCLNFLTGGSDAAGR